MKGLAPLAAPLPGVGVDHLRVDALLLLSDEAKALVIGPMLDLQAVLLKADTSEFSKRLAASMIRRVIKGMYEYELRREEPRSAVDIDTTRW